MVMSLWRYAVMMQITPLQILTGFQDLSSLTVRIEVRVCDARKLNTPWTGPSRRPETLIKCRSWISIGRFPMIDCRNIMVMFPLERGRIQSSSMTGLANLVK